MTIKALIMPDQFDWALGFVADALIKNITDIEFTKMRSQRIIRVRRSSVYDRVFVMYPKMTEEFYPNSSTFIGGINSFIELDVKNPAIDSVGIADRIKLSKYERLYVPCKLLQEYLLTQGIFAYRLPYGIDVKKFCPQQRSRTSKLVVGFAGHPTNHGNKKGYFDYILPAVGQCKNVELKSALGGEKSVPFDEMVNFYNSIDVLICMSRTETGPLPVLEAMACGTPVISTRVGMVPEVISHQENGILIDRNIQSLVTWLNYFANNREELQSLGAAAHRSIQAWDWPVIAPLWRDFILGTRLDRLR